MLKDSDEICSLALKAWIAKHGGRHPQKLSLSVSERNLALWEENKKKKSFKEE